MFFVVLGTVLGLMHLYVWKRLIKDTTKGRARWMCTVGLVGVGMASALGPPDLLRLPVRLRRLDPDLVAIVGDLVDGTVEELGTARLDRCRT